jgi:hypothetical protein
MRAGHVPLGEVLDETGEVVPEVAAPWVGVLWATAVPLRLLQAHMGARLFELGDEAGRYGDYLSGLALWLTVALLVALLGRAVFVRAVNLRLSTARAPGWAVLRLAPASVLSYLYAALAIEAATYASAFALVTLPAGVLLSGLAAATAPLAERLSLVRPFSEILRHGRRLGTLFALLVVFGIAFLLASLNGWVLSRLSLWLAGGVGGLDVTRWVGVLGPTNVRFWLVILLGGWLVVEPFWLASLTIFVHKCRARASGEDLRLWFDRLRREAA